MSFRLNSLHQVPPASTTSDTLQARSLNDRNEVPLTISQTDSVTRVPPIITPVVPLPPAAEFEVYANKIIFPIARRSYDSGYDLCLGVPLGEDFKTNSLSNVCNFVSNANDSFVSLAPTAAAYMPSWLDYLVSFIAVGIALIFTRIHPQLEHHYQGMSNAAWGTMGAIFGVLFAATRTGLAIYQIAAHSQSFDTLPFISPLLWVDWLVIARICGGRFRSLTIPIVLCIWIICSWLCIGYGFLNYGTRQYEVLEMSKKCEPPMDQPQISWQTDPRRIRILDLHYVIFGFATLGFFEGWSAFRKAKLSRDRARFIYGHEVHKLMSLGIGVVVLICLAVGMVLVGLLNEAEYLILTQNNCYASYVSSRTTYMYVDLLDWCTRLGEWFGVSI